MNNKFEYPMWFKCNKLDKVVRFEELTEGLVVKQGSSVYKEGEYYQDFVPHTDTDIWEDVTHLYKMVSRPSLQSMAEKKPFSTEEKDTSKNNGGKTDYYQLPSWIKDFDDFAEWRGLNGFQFNMGKAMWTFNTERHSGTNDIRDLNKIIHYAKRELERIKKMEIGNE